MCQQCVEKLIKAYIASIGKNPALIHNLLRLSEDAGFLNVMPENLRFFLADLNPFYIKARYGEYKDELSKICTAETAKIFITNSEIFAQWLKPKIK